MQPDELKDRVEAKRRELRQRLVELADDTGEYGETHEPDTARRIRRGLAEVEGYLYDGWANVSKQVEAKLREWVCDY